MTEWLYILTSEDNASMNVECRFFYVLLLFPLGACRRVEFLNILVLLLIS